MLRRAFLSMLGLAPAAAAGAVLAKPDPGGLATRGVATMSGQTAWATLGHPTQLNTAAFTAADATPTRAAWLSAPITAIRTERERVIIDAHVLPRADGGAAVVPNGVIDVPGAQPGAMLRVSWDPAAGRYLAEPYEHPLRDDVILVGYALLPK